MGEKQKPDYTAIESVPQPYNFSLPEYASVGYMAKRIQMRKNRFLALQKMAEQKKNEALNASNAAMNDGGPDHHGMPKQTVRGPCREIGSGPWTGSR